MIYIGICSGKVYAVRPCPDTAECCICTSSKYHDNREYINAIKRNGGKTCKICVIKCPEYEKIQAMKSQRRLRNSNKVLEEHIQNKLKVFRDVHITLTLDELNHIRSLPTVTAVDNFAKDIFDDDSRYPQRVIRYRSCEKSIRIS